MGWQLNFIGKYSQSQRIAIILLLCAIGIQGVVSIIHTSITIDELCYVGSGKMLFETGNFRSNALVYHPPLSYYLNSIFLLPFPVDSQVWQGNDCWTAGNRLVFHSGHAPQTIMFLARLPFVILALLAGALLLRWATELYGPKSGLLALALYVFWPATIGYASIATTDFTVSAMMMFSLYFFWRWCQTKTVKNASIAGVFLGLALASKITAIILIPSFIGIVLLLRFKKKITWNCSWKSIAVMLGVAFVVIFSLYGFQVTPLSLAYPPEHYADKARGELAQFPFSKPLLVVYDRVPLPATSYIAEFGNLLYISSQPKSSYVFGEVVDFPPWYFGLLTLIMKINTAGLLLMVLFMALAMLGRLPLEKLESKLCLYVPLAFLLINFAVTNKASGVRHMLAVAFLLFIIVSKVAATKKKMKLLELGVAALLLWYAAEGMASAPNYLSHANLFVGGATHAHEVVVGSNIDLGQDLKGLREYMQQHGIERVKLSYFGSVDPSEYGIKYDYLPSPAFLPWVPDYTILPVKEREEDCTSKRGVVVVSITNLKGVHLLNHSCYDWLWDKAPVAKIGHTLWIFDIPPVPPQSI